MDTNSDSAHQSQNEDNFPTFSHGLEFLNEAEKAKTPCPRVKCNKFWQKDTLLKPNKWQTSLFQTSKVSLKFSVLKLLNIKLELWKENFK